MNHFFKLTLTLLLTQNCVAEDNCIECGNRKLSYCAEECGLVPPERVKDCQKLCIKQYCSHKCQDELELDSLFNQECENCKEQQYPLCNTTCDIKSEYKKASCQIDCSNKRCEDKCNK